MSEKKLSTMEIDAIGEILNISLGASATAVSTMLEARVDITTPVVRVATREEFTFSNLKPAIGVEISYIEGLSGKNVMLLKRSDVKVIVEMLMGMNFTDEEFELNEMNISAISEVMNQMMGASSTALSELFGRPVNISTPQAFEVDGEEAFKEKYFTDEEAMVVIRFSLSIGDKMESEFLNLMPIELAKDLVKGFFTDGLPDAEEEKPKEKHIEEEKRADAVQETPVQGTTASTFQETVKPQSQATAQESTAQSSEQPAPAQMPSGQPISGQVAQVQPTAGLGVMEQTMQMMQQQMMQMQQQMMQMQNAQTERRISVKKAPAPSLAGEDHVEDPDANLDLLMNVPLELSVEIGRTKKLVKDILELSKGSLVVLDRIAGEPVDLYVNGECIAKGDVVVVDDNFAIRITEILEEDVAVEA